VRDWDAERVARAAGASLLAAPPATGPAAGPPAGPRGAGVDSRAIGRGELFVGLSGEHADGGAYAARALEAGAWGVLVAQRHAGALVETTPRGAVLAHPDPLSGLQALARSWSAELRAGGAKIVAITGSTGKTSTKDILAALLSPQRRTVASPENFNTEIGLPLAVLGAPPRTEVLVLELAMRGPGQIAQLTAIARPDMGMILNVGPSHVELLGSLEAIAAAKAELIAGMRPGSSLLVPADEPLLGPYLRADMNLITFGDGRDGSLGAAVSLAERRPDGTVVIRDRGEDITLRPSFSQAHNLRNLVAAVAAARALGVTPEGRVEVRFAALRGERFALPDGVALIDDCYNANPMSMRAAIDDLAETAPARRVAILGDMLELGPDAGRYHREIGEYAAARGVQLLVTVGALAAEMRPGFAGEAHSVDDPIAAAELLEALLREGDTVLVKGSRRLGLERVAETLRTPKQRERAGAVLARSVGSGRR
jgi:UDP-N-acetylmuramoyl-tripeptide--D-alanyl-D-alanine ligase